MRAKTARTLRCRRADSNPSTRHVKKTQRSLEYCRRTALGFVWDWAWSMHLAVCQNQSMSTLAQETIDRLVQVIVREVTRKP